MDWSKKLDEMFERIKEENEDYDERIANGDLFIPNCLFIGKPFKINEVFYICDYYATGKNIIETDKKMARMKLSNYQLKSIKKKLKKLNIIKEEKYTVEELKEATIQLSHKGLKCEWCNQETYILHKHHYPISHKNGGKEVVNICPNCHYTFHKLESENCL